MAENTKKKVTDGEKVKSTKKASTTKKAPAKRTKKVEETKPVEVKEEVKEVATVTEATAVLRNYGATPRKVRLVIDLVRGKDIEEAYAILDNCPKACAKAVKKLIMSAAANAVNNFKMNENGLYVASIQASDAIKLKRILPRAKGSASGLVKRWSHITVTVKNREAK